MARNVFNWTKYDYVIGLVNKNEAKNVFHWSKYSLKYR